MAFLNIENKQDSPEKLAAIVGKPHNQFLFAGELNETVEKINELAAMVPSQIITTGTVTFDEIERKATISGFTYRLAGMVYTPLDLESAAIPEEEEGFIKVYHVLGNSLGFLIIAGDSSETQIDPAPVPGTIYLTRFVVTGSVIGEPEAPITGGEFVKKVYSNKQLLFTPASEGIFELPSDGRTSFEFKHGNQEFYGFSLPEDHEHLHEGKLFYFKNTSGEPILIKHNFAADIKTNLPNGDDLVFESAVDKVLMFKFSWADGLTLLNGSSVGGNSDLLWSYSNILANPFEHAGTTLTTIMDVCEIPPEIDLTQSLIFDIEMMGRAYNGTVCRASFYICDENLNLVNGGDAVDNTNAGMQDFGDVNKLILHKRTIYKHSNSRTYGIDNSVQILWSNPGNSSGRDRSEANYWFGSNNRRFIVGTLGLANTTNPAKFYGMTVKIYKG